MQIETGLFGSVFFSCLAGRKAIKIAENSVFPLSKMHASVVV
jgi:hypothetical protein